MNTLREQARERSGTYSALTRAGVREADFLAGARAALEAARAKRVALRDGSKAVLVDDIDALIQSLEP